MRRIDLKKANAARSNTIRDINRQIVLNYVRELGPISRAAIARETALQRSTISLIVDDLRLDGLIIRECHTCGLAFIDPRPNQTQLSRYYSEGYFQGQKDFFRGKEITNLIVSFVGGKVTSMTGSGPGFQDMKAEYDAAGPGKELFSFVDFGINPGLHIWPTSKLGNWIQAGMVTVGTGNNTWAGGDVKVPYGINNHLPGCTVTLDGKTIIDKGVWKS